MRSMSSLAAPVSAAEADELSRALADASAAEILRRAAERFPGRDRAHVLVAAYLQRARPPDREPVARRAHRRGRHRPAVPRDARGARPSDRRAWASRSRRCRPRRTVAEQAIDRGAELWLREPDACCGLRKVEPLERALAGTDAWVSGLRRASGGERSHGAPVLVRRDARRDQGRADLAVERPTTSTRTAPSTTCPCTRSTRRAIPSIGCVPCTRAVAPGEDERAGRWAGTTKTECGLHRPRV